MADVRVGGRARGLPATTVRRVVGTVLAGERREAAISVTFLGPEAMRRLNHQHQGKDRPTDVLAFTLQPPDGSIVGDIYVCPAVARAEARQRGIPVRSELIRLVIHGTLHVLGHDHPDSEARERSPMWQRQERYRRRLA